MKSDNLVLRGQTEEHVMPWGSENARIHQGMSVALTSLSDALKKNGFELGIASSFRSFEAQLKIWNAKATGQRPLLDSQAKPLEFSKLTPKEIVSSILRWSALPGLSRHHWGTDLDVYDRKSLPEGYQVQLIPSEFEGQGYFSKMHQWLDQNMEQYGFFRPYAKDLGGVSPERWHISYAPLADKFLKSHSVILIEQVIKITPIELKETILSDIETIFSQYFLNVNLLKPQNG